MYGRIAYNRRLDYKTGRRNSFRPSVPALSIGTLTVGGVGKTPLAIELARRLIELGYRPGILLRGFLRVSKEPIVLSADDFKPDRIPAYGDEPALISFISGVPVGIGADRKQVLECLLDQTLCDIILLDDGFQHRRLQRDMDWVILEGERPFGNGYCLPYGPLREPVKALDEADTLIIHGGRIPQEIETLPNQKWDLFCGSLQWKNFRPFRAWIEKRNEEDVDLSTLTQTPIYLLSGVGNPERFQKQAEEQHFHVVKHIEFFDHHWYTQEDARTLLAQTGDSPVLTTEKDAIRFLPLMESIPPALIDKIIVIQARWSWVDEERFTAWFQSKFPPRR